MKKGEKTKVYIIELAIDQSFKIGFDNISFNGLAKVSGLSQPAFYKHFKNKIDLLYQCLLYSAQSGREFIDSYEEVNTDAKNKLKNYLLGNLKWSQSKPQEAHILISMYYFAKNDESIKETFEIITKTGITRITSILFAGVREGLWQEKNINDKANLIQNLLIGEIIKRFHDKNLGLKDQNFIDLILELL